MRTPALGVMKFTIWVDLSFFIITIYKSLSDPCLGIKKILKGIMHFYNMTYMATPAPGIMKFTIWVDPSHVIYIYTQFV